ncbi:cupin domain-containing protein [Geminicoccus harenae]|uniref:cupin domain-containing protein n=1 Tax=Geminicoccus harenae TaxID=2498453 RepID=UPI00168B6410|nr:cupin domain-containing protein [Geminicoccus harenae]
MVQHHSQALRFEDAGSVPNNPHLPLIWWQGALEPDAGPEAFEARFAQNGWGRSWRNGIFDYPHFHTNNHEVLGIARGRVRVRLGGDTGTEVELAAGDVVLIPAGVGHQNLGASDDLLVVGAYPPGEEVDLVRDASGDEAARARIAAVPLPATDPLDGPDGELMREWRARP